MSCGIFDEQDIALFVAWPWELVDWKWEYMADMLNRLSIGIYVFLLKWNSDKFQQRCAEDNATQAVNLQALKQIEAAQRDCEAFACRTEVYNVFGSAVKMPWPGSNHATASFKALNTQVLVGGQADGSRVWLAGMLRFCATL